jgi:hypothetical protein
VWAEGNEQFFNFHNELACEQQQAAALFPSQQQAGLPDSDSHSQDSCLSRSDMDQEHHARLRCANFAFFCCREPPHIGGYTILSDARRVHARLAASIEMPAAFKFVIARKSLSGRVPKAPTGDYESFLCGEWEFEQHPDQWSPGDMDLDEVMPACSGWSGRRCCCCSGRCGTSLVS